MAEPEDCQLVPTSVPPRVIVFLSPFLSLVPRVKDQWHRDPEYCSRTWHPVLLWLRGRGMSLRFQGSKLKGP